MLVILDEPSARRRGLGSTLYVKESSLSAYHIDATGEQKGRDRFMQQVDWEELAGRFQFNGRLVDVKPITLGHINDTYAVTMDQPDGQRRRYILQRINHTVFQNPPQVMQNIEAVTEHIRAKVIAAGGDPERETVNLVLTQDGQSYLHTEDGNYWRATQFIEGARTYDEATGPLFYNAGKAFGQFMRLLDDFPADSLHETIPQFHDTRKRYNDLMEAVENDAAGRAAQVQAEIDFAKAREADASVVVDLIAAGKIPLRVTHNDTKLNNVMICDTTGEAICVVDLDTVMPGSALYDFGDAVRFGASTAAEDETDLSKVGIDLELFRQFTEGYLAAAGDVLTGTELDLLAFSAKLITYELGMRFLTDYLNGDVYFKIHRPDHNLERARAQFRLVEDMEAKMEQMQAIVREAYEAAKRG